MARKIAAGNWKMNGLGDDLGQLSAIATTFADPPFQIVICPPATLLSRAAALAGPVHLGGQDCHPRPSGAHTGDISAEMLRDAGASHVILGHSERRADHGETDALVAAKAEAAVRAGLVAIICVGETLEQREAGQTLDIVGNQLRGSVPAGFDALSLVVAYEPVWAIGTGKVPSIDEIAEVHAFLRLKLSERMGPDAADVPLLYGGSVKASNAAQIFAVPDVDGALVGGASLKAADFCPIVEALAAS